MSRIYGIIGLGYVGLELSVALSKHDRVIGYDQSKRRIDTLTQGIDEKQLFNTTELKASPTEYTTHIRELDAANFYIVAVPTPAYYYDLPNLESLINATQNLATIINKGDIVVYESTVYPGTTEEVCLKILEEVSGLSCGVDFNIGYSPERISPNDKKHTLHSTPKVISACNAKALEEITLTYKKICKTVYPVSTIKVAEATKILENTQRDINIAFINEFTKIMHALDVDTHETIEAAKTKWNFVPFKPGLVGGHCISVDPLYLAFKAKRHSIDPQLIQTARNVNDSMTLFIIEEMIKILIRKSANLKDLKIGVLGVTYKENVSDIRNSLSLKLLKELKNYQLNYVVHDPYAEKDILQNQYNIELENYQDLHSLNVIILCVGHQYYIDQGLEEMLTKLIEPKIIMDIPNLFIEMKSRVKNTTIWTL